MPGWWYCSCSTGAEVINEAADEETVFRGVTDVDHLELFPEPGLVATPSASSERLDASEVEADLPRVAEEPAEEEEQEDEEGPFVVNLDMMWGERLGAVFDVLDMKTLRVLNILEEGRLKRYNDSAPRHKRILPGYFIVDVNGKNGRAEDMVKELRRSRIVRLRIARRQEFSVTLEKSGPLCLDLQYGPEKDCLVIRRIGEGVVRTYNQEASSEEPHIKVGDRILGVNSAQAPARTLLESIRNNRELTMKFERPQC